MIQETFMPPEIKNKEIDLKEISKLEFSAQDIYSMLSRTRTGMSWGMNSAMNHYDKILSFKVQGFLHKGWVYISLDYDDTFKVTLTKPNKTSIIREIKGVYIDQLLEVIDSYVEKNVSDKEYKQLITNSFK